MISLNYNSCVIMFMLNNFNVNLNIEGKQLDVQFIQQLRRTRGAVEIGDNLYTYTCPANQRQRVQQILKQVLEHPAHSVEEFKTSLSIYSSHMDQKVMQTVTGIVTPLTKKRALISDAKAETMD